METMIPYQLGRWGTDVCSRKIDELDQACIQFALARKESETAGIDIGCGLGRVSIGMATLGVRMNLIDILPLQHHFDEVLGKFPTMPLTFLQADVRHVKDVDLLGRYDFVLSRRFLHYVPYCDAVELITRFSQRLVQGGKVFISASGLESELGIGYIDICEHISNRFDYLSSSMMEKHNIREKVCLYRPSELIHLFQGCGFEGHRVWLSAFGNVQGVFTKPKIGGEQ
jgi:2-polyprenyl-3-methyl-5-hydroxy-6-metoxy-1,4-benzoquinol methylase